MPVIPPILQISLLLLAFCLGLYFYVLKNVG